MTHKIKKLKEQPLLNPPDASPPKIEVRETDWKLMREELEATRERRKGRDSMRMLYLMNYIDETRAPKPTDEDQKLMEEMLAAARNTKSGKELAETLHYMKALGHPRLQITEEDEKIMYGETRLIGGEAQDYFYHMKYLYGEKAPNPTEDDWRAWKETLASCKESQGPAAPSFIAPDLHRMKAVDPEKAPKPKKEDLEAMKNWLNEVRTWKSGSEIALALYYLTGLTEEPTTKTLKTPGPPPLKKYRK